MSRERTLYDNTESDLPFTSTLTLTPVLEEPRDGSGEVEGRSTVKVLLFGGTDS